MSMGKIMVADDDTNICELLRLYLEKEGYTVTLAHDGESAVEQFFADTPDLLLLDIMMPRLMAGRSAGRSAKSPIPPLSCSPPRGRPSTRCWGWNWGRMTTW